MANQIDGGTSPTVTGSDLLNQFVPSTMDGQEPTGRMGKAAGYEFHFSPVPPTDSPVFQGQGWRPSPNRVDRVFKGYTGNGWFLEKWLEVHGVNRRGPLKPDAGVVSARPEGGDEPFRNSVVAEQERDRERLRDSLRVILGREPTPQEMAQAWEQGLDAMEAAESLGEEPHDPFHWLQQQADFTREERRRNGLDPETGLPERVQPRTVTDKTIQTALTDPATARLLINDWARQSIGRELRDDERAAFASQLGAAEKASPRTTVTETDIGPDEADPTKERVLGTRTTETGQAINPGAFAEEFGDDQFEGEKADYWDDTTGTQVLMQLIEGF